MREMKNNKFQVGRDGKTAYERAKGKKFNKEICEFGDCILFRRGKSNSKTNKLDPKWFEGVYLGMC